MTAPLNGIDAAAAHELEARRVADALDALAQSMAALEPGIERLLVNASADPALLDRARRSARRLRLHVERITLVVDGQAPAPWHGQARPTWRACPIGRPLLPNPSRLRPTTGSRSETDFGRRSDPE